MKYIVYDQIRNGDLYTGEFDILEEAIRYAEREWGLLSDHDKARRECYGVLESVNPDPEAIDHMDGNFVWTPNPATYVVRDREAGNVIERVSSIEEGEALIAEYEEEDRRDGTYTPDFYEVAEI